MTRDTQESEQKYHQRLNGEVRDLAERISRVETENKHQSETLEDVANSVKSIDGKLDEMRQEVATEEDIAEVEAEVTQLEEDVADVDNRTRQKLKKATVWKIVKYGGSIATGSMAVYVAQVMI